MPIRCSFYLGSTIAGVAANQQRESHGWIRVERFSLALVGAALSAVVLAVRAEQGLAGRDLAEKYLLSVDWDFVPVVNERRDLLAGTQRVHMAAANGRSMPRSFWA